MYKNPFPFSLQLNQKRDLEKATTAGFEPARAKPNRFLVCLLNHSDKLSRNLLQQMSTSIIHMTLE